MLAAVGCEWQTDLHLGCCRSQGDFSGPGQGKGYYIFPWVYTVQDQNIRGCHQFCWCMSLLCYNGHIHIVRRENLWYLRGFLLLMNALHINWLSRRHQFSSIPASAAAARMVSSTCIILAPPFLILLLVDSVCRTSWVDVWQNMRPWDGGLPHSLVGGPIMRPNEVSLISISAVVGHRVIFLDLLW